MKTLLSIFVLLLAVHWGNAQNHYQRFDRTLNKQGGKVNLNLLALNEPIRLRNDRMYFWLKSHEVHETQGDYAGQLLDGDYVRLDANNNLAEKGAFASGLKHGVWKSWYPNGLMASSTSWWLGEFHGPTMTYDSTGQLAAVSNYRNGKMHGPQFVYKDGKLLSEERYRRGKKVEKRPLRVKSEKPELVPMKPVNQETEEPVEKKPKREKKEAPKAAKKEQQADREKSKEPFSWLRNPFQRKQEKAPKKPKKMKAKATNKTLANNPENAHPTQSASASPEEKETLWQRLFSPKKSTDP